jgi:hypothetical protein
VNLPVVLDAPVVAVAASFGGALVISSDAEDINRLAQAVPAARIVVRKAHR